MKTMAVIVLVLGLSVSGWCETKMACDCSCTDVTAVVPAPAEEPVLLPVENVPGSGQDNPPAEDPDGPLPGAAVD